MYVYVYVYAYVMCMSMSVYVCTYYKGAVRNRQYLHSRPRTFTPQSASPQAYDKPPGTRKGTLKGNAEQQALKESVKEPFPSNPQRQPLEGTEARNPKPQTTKP